MQYSVRPTTRFRKDLKLMVKRGLDPAQLSEVIKLLARGERLPEKYSDHALRGEYQGCRECHIQPDWLLVYEQDDKDLYLYLIRTGTHSDLFS
jgi:mRNA interferase YafQ